MAMKRAQIAHLKANLSRYLAEVRGGATVVVCDRNTPIARLVPYPEHGDDFVVSEPERSTADLKSVPGVKIRRGVDPLRILRESRDQR
jgi:prevent-host-death family protein